MKLMFKKEVVSHLLVTLIWLVIITLLRWDWHWNSILLWLGGLVGTFLIDIDHLIYTLWLYPHELTGMRVKRLTEQRRFKEVFNLLVETKKERVKLIFHNALFQAPFYVLCFFVLTSTGSLFGAGLVMAMVLHLLKGEIECLLRGREGEAYLRQWLFWPIKGEVSFTQQRVFVVLMLALFLGLNLFLI